MATPLPLSSRYWRPYTLGKGKSLAASLPSGEEWIGSFEGVGLYLSNDKVPGYQDLFIHISTHRLFLLPSPSSTTSTSTTAGPGSPLNQNNASSSSSRTIQGAMQTDLLNVRQTEFYVGFMRSSPKITISLGPLPPSHPLAQAQPDSTASASASSSRLNVSTPNGTAYGNGNGNGIGAQIREERGWTCGVCGQLNPTDGRIPTSSEKCSLCGVTYEISLAAARSNPVSRSSTPVPTSPVSASPIQAQPPSQLPTSSLDEGDRGKVACEACTFLNSPLLKECEICGTPLPRKSTSGAGLQGRKLDTGPDTSSNSSTTEVIRLSFRRGGEKEAYRKLKSVLSQKAWERDGGRKRASQDGTSTPRSGAGIDGILQSIRLEAQQKDESMQTAFQDLEVLMVRAGEMVRLAQSLSAKLASHPSPSKEETTLLRTSLVQLGLPAPALTQDMVKSDEAYYQGLAKELGGLLVGENGDGGVMGGKEGRGVVGLDEIWGLWMRARGVALLPPSTLIQVLPYLPTQTQPPINSLTLPSSLLVLHTPKYSPPSLLARILSLLTPSASALPPPSYSPSSPISPIESRPSDNERSLSVVEISAHENLAIGLVNDLLDNIETNGVRLERTFGVSGIVRDDQARGGTRWYRDIISLWSLDHL